MNTMKFAKALGHLEDDLIVEAQTPVKNRIWLALALPAAVLLLVAAVILFVHFTNEPAGLPEDSPVSILSMYDVKSIDDLITQGGPLLLVEVVGYESEETPGEPAYRLENVSGILYAEYEYHLIDVISGTWAEGAEYFSAGRKIGSYSDKKPSFEEENEVKIGDYLLVSMSKKAVSEWEENSFIYICPFDGAVNLVDKETGKITYAAELENSGKYKTVKKLKRKYGKR